MTAGMSDRRAPVGRGFRDVDAQARRLDFGAYLERVARIMAAEKAASHDLLEPAPGHRLLDVGCGNGDDVRALAGRVASTGQVVGVDHSQTMIEAARERGVPGGADFGVADAHQLPFADGCFDAARIERTLQHVADPLRVLAEMRRVVRRDGIVVASEPDWGTLVIDSADREATREVVRRQCDDHTRHGWIGRQLAGYFTHLDIAAIEVRPVTLVLRSFPVAVDILGLADSGDASWLADLCDRDRHGAFLASMTGFTVSGRVA